MSSATSSDGAFFGESSSLELSAEDDDELLVILEKKLERTGVAGTLFEADLEGVFFEEGRLFDVSVLEGLGLDGASFSFSFSLSFDEELFDDFDLLFGDLGGSVLDLGGSVLDLESFGAGELSGNAPIGVEVFAGVAFGAPVFDEEEAFGAAAGFGAAAFGDGGFAAAGAAFGVALGMVTFGGG